MFRIALLVLALILPALAHAESGDPVTDFSASDPRMNAAIDTANASLPAFLANMTDGQGNGMAGTAIKVAFPTSNGAEIIWVSPFKWDGDIRFAGLLSNQPNFMDGLNAGDVVQFETSMVRDWSMVAPDGTMWGNYTTRVMLPELDAATAAILTARLSADPVPSDWN